MSDSHALLDALSWQIELGVDVCVCEEPIDRYALEPAPPATAPRASPEPAPPAKPAPPPVPVLAESIDTVAAARDAAAQATDLPALNRALADFPHCDLKHGARNCVFSDGHPSARLMILGEAPGRDEDQEGRPFVGRAGQLLDKMLGAIAHDRATDDPDRGVYITNILPWRPPQNRDPRPEEIAMMKPFVERHIELANPDVLVLMGNIACAAMLGRKGITRLRGNWTDVLGRPTLPMFHPAFLLRQPVAKREAWADLLALQSRLRQGATP